MVLLQKSSEAPEKTKAEKKAEKKKKRRDSAASGEEDELDEQCLDWWSKYFASMETMIRVRHGMRLQRFFSIETYMR